ncbi:hypothetical protein Ancab_013113 [Ancistrocladus abbreviatus]
MSTKKSIQITKNVNGVEHEAQALSDEEVLKLNSGPNREMSAYKQQKSVHQGRQKINGHPFCIKMAEEVTGQSQDRPPLNASMAIAVRRCRRTACRRFIRLMPPPFSKIKDVDYGQNNGINNGPNCYLGLDVVVQTACNEQNDEIGPHFQKQVRRSTRLGFNMELGP